MGSRNPRDDGTPSTVRAYRPVDAAEVTCAVNVLLRGVLQPEGFERWWRTPLPACNGATAEELLADGEQGWVKLLVHVARYHEGMVST